MIPEHYKAVIQLSNDDSQVQKSVIGQIANLMAALPDIRIELVIHSRGINLVFKNNHREFLLESLVKSGKVKIMVCNNTLKSMNLHAEDLIPAAEIIPSAIAHLVIRQQEGWSYIKGGF